MGHDYQALLEGVCPSQSREAGVPGRGWVVVTPGESWGVRNGRVAGRVPQGSRWLLGGEARRRQLELGVLMAVNGQGHNVQP